MKLTTEKLYELIQESLDPDHERKNKLLIEKVEAFKIYELPAQQKKTRFFYFT